VPIQVLAAVLDSWRMLAAWGRHGTFGGPFDPSRADKGSHVMEQTGVGGQRQD